MTAAERKSLCSVDAAALKAEAADLSARMEKGVRVVFGSKEAVEAAKEQFDRVETQYKYAERLPETLRRKLSERSPVCGKEHRQGIFVTLKYYLQDKIYSKIQI